MLEGRVFSDSDNRTSMNVAIVDEDFREEVSLSGRDPIGAHFGDWDESTAGLYTIVRVVEDAQYWPPNDLQEQGHPTCTSCLRGSGQKCLPRLRRLPYFEDFQVSTHYMGSLELETHGRVPDLEARVGAVLQQINSNLMITRIQSFDEQVNLGFSQQQMIAQLTSLFGLIALALAAIGLYGVTAYAVAQRTNEIGIRMALGANRLTVAKMVLRTAFLQVGVGLLIGLPAAIAACHLMTAELFGVDAWSPLVLGTTTAMLAGVAFPCGCTCQRDVLRVWNRWRHCAGNKTQHYSWRTHQDRSPRTSIGVEFLGHPQRMANGMGLSELPQASAATSLGRWEAGFAMPIQLPISSNDGCLNSQIVALH